jgi:phage-related protein
VIAVRYYRSPAGAEPMREYLAGLERADAEKVAAALLDIAEHGLPAMPSTYSPGQAPAAVTVRVVKGKLWELKVSAQRVFYVVALPVMVLLHAYRKQGQKAPRREIETALARMNEVLGE